MTRTKVVIDRNQWLRVVHVGDERELVTVRRGTQRVECRRTNTDISLLADDNTMCCLGFICRELLRPVLTDEQIVRLLLNELTPRGLISAARRRARVGGLTDDQLIAITQALTAPWNGSTDDILCAPQEAAMRVNDLVNDDSDPVPELPLSLTIQPGEDREVYLTRLMAPFGIDLEFVGERDPYEITPVPEGENNATA